MLKREREYFKIVSISSTTCSSDYPRLYVCLDIFRPLLGVGVWFLMNDNTCLGEPYNPEEIDPFITTARAALSSSMATGLIGGLVVFFEFLLCEVCCASCIAMISYISAWILSACTFIIYLCEPCVGFGFEEVQQLDSSTFADTAIEGNQCDYGPASTLNAVACILYLICAILFCW